MTYITPSDILANSLKEAENLLFLQEHSQVRVPKLYSAFITSAPFLESPGGIDIYFTIVEFLEGGCLGEERWRGLDDWSRDTICSRLSEQFQLLRAVPQGPQTYYGRVNYQSFSWKTGYLRLRYKDMYGPYDTYEDLVLAMYRSFELQLADSCTGTEYHPHFLEALPEFKPALLRSTNRRPVLTHTDPFFRNIIARPVEDEGNKITDWEVTSLIGLV
jgi:hypothetical protein